MWTLQLASYTSKLEYSHSFQLHVEYLQNVCPQSKSQQTITQTKFSDHNAIKKILTLPI